MGRIQTPVYRLYRNGTTVPRVFDRQDEARAALNHGDVLVWLDKSVVRLEWGSAATPVEDSERWLALRQRVKGN